MTDSQTPLTAELIGTFTASDLPGSNAAQAALILARRLERDRAALIAGFDNAIKMLEYVTRRIDEAVDRKIHTGRLEPIGGLLSELQDQCRMQADDSRATLARVGGAK